MDNETMNKSLEFYKNKIRESMKKNTQLRKKIESVKEKLNMNNQSTN